jgi:hypothetical protein
MQMDWDDKQLKVINADKSTRQIVEAGPGTGKTAVACARVAALIDDFDVHPSKIWLLSFTRTAVREIRNRIEEYVKDPKDALSVKVTTLDSQVWYLRQGFDEQDVNKLLNSYDANISKIIELIDNQDDNLLDYIEEIDHIIIDEAQDLVGVRSQLILTLGANIKPKCGVTVFADSAQAIYGFTTENGYQNGNGHKSLVEQLATGDYGDFKEIALKEVHRTDNVELLKIFTDVRELVLSNEYTAEEKVEQIKNDITSITGNDLPHVRYQKLHGRNDLLLLYRTRAEVLQASSYLWGSGVAHKLRMSGLPNRVHPWIARLFCDYLESTINKENFFDRWKARINNEYGDSLSVNRSWKDLLQYANKGNDSVDIRTMRRVLSRSRPPIEFIVDEFILPGPMLGTIHASKGREADAVHLMLPKEITFRDDSTDSQIDEEGRVIFVGATRARKELRVGDSSKANTSRLKKSGRIFKIGSNPKWYAAQTEFIRENDVDVYKHLEKEMWVDWDDVEESPSINQEYLWENCIERVDLYAQSSADTEFFYWLHAADESKAWIASLGRYLNYDLWEVAKEVEKRKKTGELRPSAKIKNLYMVGSKSVVLPEDDENLSKLLTPYSHTGIFLVPCLSGFTNVYFNEYKKKDN